MIVRLLVLVNIPIDSDSKDESEDMARQDVRDALRPWRVDEIEVHEVL